MVDVDRALKTDPRFLAFAKGVKRADVESVVDDLELNLSSMLGFYNQLDVATRTKVRAGRLDPRIETRVAQAGDLAIQASTHAFERMDELERLLRHSEMDKLINSHLPIMTKNFDDNDHVRMTLAKFRSMGASESSIKCVRDELAKSNYDLLRFRGADGTISGLIASVKSKLADLQHVVGVIRKQGVPTMVGSGHSSFWSDPVTWIIIGIGIVVVVGGTIVAVLAA